MIYIYRPVETGRLRGATAPHQILAKADLLPKNDLEPKNILLFT